MQDMCNAMNFEANQTQEHKMQEIGEAKGSRPSQAGILIRKYI